jgi:pimeloyl-ACP methyl ester carboxylesterase
LATAQQFWSRITSPTLVVGAQSVLRHSPEEEERRRRCIPQSQLVVLDGAAHMMQRHRPRELAALLRGFLASP